MEMIGYILLPAFVAGIIQGVTGFGAGVVMMMFLPLQFSVVQSAGVSSAICMILCAAMVYRYRHTISKKYPVNTFYSWAFPRCLRRSAQCYKITLG